AEMSPNRRDYLDELKGPVRRAAEQVRATEPPPAAVDRSVERTRRALRKRNAQRPRFRRDLLAVAGMAAAILLGIGLWNSYQGNPPRVADRGTTRIIPDPEVAAHDQLKIHEEEDDVRRPNSGEEKTVLLDKNPDKEDVTERRTGDKGEKAKIETSNAPREGDVVPTSGRVTPASTNTPPADPSVATGPNGSLTPPPPDRTRIPP